MNPKRLAIFNAVSLAVHIAAAYISQTRLINGRTVGEVSDKFPSLFTPAGVTFSIWALIYLALAAFCIYHLVRAFKNSPDDQANRDLQKIGYSFVINNLATTGWLFAWTSEQLLLSVILILIQLLTLMVIHHRLHIHDASRKIRSKFFTQFPLSIYIGWISIATIANISSYLTSINWTGWGVSAINWAITMIGIAVLLSMWIINRRKNVLFGLVVIWALYGIILKRQSINESDFEPIIMVAWGGIAIISAAVLFGLVRNLRITARSPH